jgi:hypothetical protein
MPLVSLGDLNFGCPGAAFLRRSSIGAAVGLFFFTSRLNLLVNSIPLMTEILPAPGALMACNVASHSSAVRWEYCRRSSLFSGAIFSTIGYLAVQPGVSF